MKRDPLWLDMTFALIACLVLIVAAEAFAAVRLVTPDAIIRPQTAKDAQKPKPRCIEARTLQRFRIGLDGAITRTMSVTILKDC